MTDAKKISQDSTIYNYTLAKKVIFGPLFRALHILLFIMFEGYEVVQYKARTGLFFVIAVVAVYLLHKLIISLLFKQTRMSHASRWKMYMSYPRMTIQPTGYIGFGTWRRVLTHMLIGGLCIIAIGYVWLPPGMVLQTVFLHLWVLVPSFRVSFSFRKINKPGLIKWQQTECGYYFS